MPFRTSSHVKDHKRQTKINPIGSWSIARNIKPSHPHLQTNYSSKINLDGRYIIAIPLSMRFVIQSNKQLCLYLLFVCEEMKTLPK